MLFSSPRSPAIPIPVKIKPIWDTDEQASVLLRSMLNSARTAPSSMVQTPIARINKPQLSSPIKI